MIDISKVQAASFLPGLQDLGSPPDQVYNIGTTFIPINGNTVKSFVLPFSRNNVISLLRLNFSGFVTLPNDKWIPIFGPTLVADVALANLAGAVNYCIYATVQSHPSGRQINLQFINNTVGATVTTPSLTMTAHAHLYSYPWA